MVNLGSHYSGQSIQIGDIWKCRSEDNPEEDCIYLNESLVEDQLIKVIYSYNNGLTWQGNITIRPDELKGYYFVRKHKRQKTGFSAAMQRFDQEVVASFIDRISGNSISDAERNASV